MALVVYKKGIRGTIVWIKIFPFINSLWKKGVGSIRKYIESIQIPVRICYLRK